MNLSLNFYIFYQIKSNQLNKLLQIMIYVSEYQDHLQELIQSKVVKKHAYLFICDNEQSVNDVRILYEQTCKSAAEPTSNDGPYLALSDDGQWKQVSDGDFYRLCFINFITLQFHQLNLNPISLRFNGTRNKLYLQVLIKQTYETLNWFMQENTWNSTYYVDNIVAYAKEVVQVAKQEQLQKILQAALEVLNSTLIAKLNLRKNDKRLYVMLLGAYSQDNTGLLLKLVYPCISLPTQSSLQCELRNKAQLELNNYGNLMQILNPQDTPELLYLQSSSSYAPLIYIQAYNGNLKPESRMHPAYCSKEDSDQNLQHPLERQWQLFLSSTSYIVRYLSPRDNQMLMYSDLISDSEEQLKDNLEENNLIAKTVQEISDYLEDIEVLPLDLFTELQRKCANDWEICYRLKVLTMQRLIGITIFHDNDKAIPTLYKLWLKSSRKNIILLHFLDSKYIRIIAQGKNEDTILYLTSSTTKTRDGKNSYTIDWEENTVDKLTKMLRVHSNLVACDKFSNALQLAAITWLKDQRNLFNGTIFVPDDSLRSVGKFNMFQGWTWSEFELGEAYEQCNKDDLSLLEKFIYYVLCNGDAETRNYLYAIFQTKERWPYWKIDNYVIIKGPQGIGKGLFIECLMLQFGPHGLELVNLRTKYSKYNSLEKQKLVFYYSEWEFARNEAEQRVYNSHITNSKLQFDQKWKQPNNEQNYRLYLCTMDNKEYAKQCVHNINRRDSLIYTSLEHGDLAQEAIKLMSYSKNVDPAHILIKALWYKICYVHTINDGDLNKTRYITQCLETEFEGIEQENCFKEYISQLIVSACNVCYDNTVTTKYLDWLSEARTDPEQPTWFIELPLKVFIEDFWFITKTNSNTYSKSYVLKRIRTLLNSHDENLELIQDRDEEKKKFCKKHYLLVSGKRQRVQEQYIRVAPYEDWKKCFIANKDLNK